MTTEWHNYQIFAKWYQVNYIEGFELDKDILIKRNKTYSPETCCFVPRFINNIMKESKGVWEDKDNKRFEASFRIKKEISFRRFFDTEERARQAYKTVKESYIKEIANKYKDILETRVFETLITYKI